MCKMNLQVRYFVLRDTYEGMNSIKSKNWDWHKRSRKGVHDNALIGHLVIHSTNQNIEKFRDLFQ